MATVKYNGTTLDPCPTITDINRVYNKCPAGNIIGVSYTATLNGILINNTGFENLLTDKSAFATLFSCPGAILEIVCDVTTVFTSCVQDIELSFSETPDNWAKSISYTLSLVLDAPSTFAACTGAYNLVEQTDRWTIEEDPECFFYNISGEEPVPRRFNISRELNATALNECGTGTITSGWQISKNWVDENLAFDEFFFHQSALQAACITGYTVFNEVRVNNIDPCAGSYGVNINWVLVEDTTGSSPLYAIDDFTVEVTNGADSKIKSVSVDGTIKGLEQATWTGGCKSVTRSKYQSSQDYYNFIVGDLHDRAETISALDLNPVPQGTSILYSPKIGQIRYSYQYNDSLHCITVPSGCVLISEDLDIAYNNPADVYAEINILGRPCPILQCLNMKTKGSKTINANIVVDCGQICHTDAAFFTSPAQTGVQAVIDSCLTHLTDNYNLVFTDQDTENWNPKTGTYSRSVVYSYSDCCTTDTGFVSTYITQTATTFLDTGDAFASARPTFYEHLVITGAETGDQILLPLAGNNIGKRLEIYNSSSVDLALVLSGSDTYIYTPTTTIFNGSGFTAIVVGNGEWEVIGTGS